jgi:hypothetical protein
MVRLAAAYYKAPENLGLPNLKFRRYSRKQVFPMVLQGHL